MGDNEELPVKQAFKEAVIENAPRGGALAATFKNIKGATEALLVNIKKFTGEQIDENFVHFVEKFVKEANTLRVGRTLSLAVFQRLLDESARFKYEALPAKDKTEFARLTQALANELRLHGGVDKASNDLSQTKQKASKSMVKFARRIQNIVRTALPEIPDDQRQKFTMNKLIQRIPP
ncbi:unnamed protein product [Caenorhabditis brenneri]